MEPEEAKQVFSQVNESIGFDLITPLNMNSEMELLTQALKEGKVYHPQFIYPDTSAIDFAGMKEKLWHLEFSKDTIGQLYAGVRDSKLKQIEMYQSVGDKDAFTLASQNCYGRPDESKMDQCYEILRQQEKEEEPTYDAKHLKEVFVHKLEEYEIHSFEIELTERIGSKVLVGDRKILIRKNAMFTDTDLRRLCAHEISTHVLRKVNGSRRNDSIFEHGTAGTMATEEGLALYNEAKSRTMNVSMLKLYAARYLSVCKMNEQSLYELALALKDTLGIRQAVYVASRIKVGLCDTSKGGGFYKDYLYFQGFLNVSQALQKDPSIYRKLYYGSVSLENLPLLEEEIETAIRDETITIPSF